MGMILTIIAEADNKKRLKAFIQNVKENRSGISCELVLVCKPNSLDMAEIQSYCDETFDLRVVENKKGIPAILNSILEDSKGEIIHITKTSCEYENKGIRKAVDLLTGQNEISIASLDAAAIKLNDASLNLMPFKSTLDKKKVNIIDLNTNIDRWCRVLFSVFMKREAIAGCSFRPELKYEYERAFLAELMAACDSYYLLPEQVTTNGVTDHDYYNYNALYDPYWYSTELENIADLLLSIKDKKRVSQRILMDFIKLQFAANSGDRNKDILQGDSFDGYLQQIKNILQKVDDDIITSCDGDLETIRVPILLDKNFLCLKYGTDTISTKAVLTDDKYQYPDKYTGKRYFFVTDTGATLATSDNLYLSIRAMNYEKGKLTVDAQLNNTYFDDEENYEVQVVDSNGEEVAVKRTYAFSLRKFFGVTVCRGYTFQFELPAESKKHIEYHVLVRVNGAEVIPQWRFTKPQSRLKQQHRHSFWEIDGRTIKYDCESRTLIIEKSNPFKRIRNEIAYWPDILENTKNKSRGFKFIALRLLYYITRPYYKNKNIWITFDQLFKGGDNGEYFYRYVSDLKSKDQTIYYVVNKDTKEYKALSKKYKTVLEYMSLKHKLISLHSNIIFTTRAYVILYAGFAKSAEAYFRGLYNFDVLCLQHGLSIQQIAQYQNRLYDNLKYYFCVSKYEIANLSKPIYGFEDKSVLGLTGAPRYDGLKGEAKKQIIISPTWRRNVTAGTNTKGSNHKYSVNFKRTKYFEIYNSLINDPKLLECSKRTGYKLIYLIHPILSPQINDFDKNDVLEIIPGSKVNYEKILVESALMLTDHSGIMYDFAYQRKPLIYYHPDELPPQYAEGGLDYETMGFGPVCKTHEHVVEELCKLMENDCRLEPKYAERIEDFFEYDDQNNCERVYVAAKEYERRKGKR